MANNNTLISFADRNTARYAKELAKVMADLEAGLIDIVAGSRTAAGEYNALVILNSRARMLKTLDDSGYNKLSETYVGQFERIPSIVSKSFTSQNIPSPKYGTNDATVFRGLASVDLDNFAAIGEKALEDLRLGLYRQAIAAEPLSNLVKTIRASTVGVDGKGSAMANHAYTHANTAILNFQGEAIRIAGESIGFDSDDSLWEVVGPDDGSTRDVCESALANPVRTKAEWVAAGYWGGAPGGWNCRHQLFPFFGELNG
jgi:hypothetical protein